MSDLNDLGARLAEELADAWQHGQRPRAEEFLDRHPALWDAPEAALPILYEEICQRQEHDEPASTAILERFPRWHKQLRVLLDCQRLFEPEPQLPVAGDTFAEFRLLAELGRGARGRVFLATQSGLADRPMVLKITPADGLEHLSLAGLQHTHIVPLYSLEEDPEGGLHGLCMPYFGGSSLWRILETLKDRPVPGLEGADLLRALDGIESASPLALPASGPARSYLTRASYVQAVCWLGACLADALSYAHQRGLVHLDLKPSNILIAADGQPMLLDFHLARPPLEPGDPAPAWLGGTTGYMSPEQTAALAAVRQRQAVPVRVDGRSDIYSLGILLFEMLAGSRLEPGRQPAAELRRAHPGVSPGLADLLACCLAPDPDKRFRDAGQLVTDLRRHLNDLPFRYLPNRHPVERWQKWRRRRPGALPMLTMAMLVVGILATGWIIGNGYIQHTRSQAGIALADAREQLAAGHADEAQRTLQRGLQSIKAVPGTRDWQDRLQRSVRQARAVELVAQLHRVTDRVRLLYGSIQPTTQGLEELQRDSAALWDARQRLLAVTQGMDANAVAEVRLDLLDLAILWSDWRLHDSGTRMTNAAWHMLDEAEAQFGSSPVLDAVRQVHREPQGTWTRQTGRNAWEHYALGRLYLHNDHLHAAAAELEQAVTLEPGNLWANYYQGVCALRHQQFADALGSFRVCVALAPGQAVCYFNRALAWDGLGKEAEALADYNRALNRDASLGAAALNRGILYFRQQHLDLAAADFEHALAAGADPAAAHYNLALVCLARHDRARALVHLEATLRSRPHDREADRLYRRLHGGS